MDIYASDEEKGEEIKQWWRDNGRSVVVGCILGAAIIFAGRYWITYKNTQSLKASYAYQQVISALSADKKSVAEDTTEKLFKNFASTPYAVFAAFEMASQSVTDKDMTAAQSYLEWVVKNADLSAHKELAKLRLAQVFLMQAKFEQALVLANGADSTTFSSLWDELKGDVLVAQGKPNDARIAYQKAIISLTQSEPRHQILQFKLDDVAESNNG